MDTRVSGIPRKRLRLPSATSVTVISTIQRATVNGAASTQGHALLVGEARKMSAHEAACAAAGVIFVPIVMEILGGMSALTVDTLASLGRLLGQRLGVNTSDSVQHLLQRCSISVWRGNSQVFTPSVDGVYRLSFPFLFLFFVSYILLICLYLCVFMLL